ncbi:MAG: prealbumin-like fold domain-containing protein [Actinomycetota bacterium]
MRGLVRRHSKRRTLVLVAVLGLMLGVGTLPSVADLAGSNFEIDDGNLKLNGTAPSIDWATVSEDRTNDDPSGASTDNSFAEGTKEEDAVPTIGVGGIPPNKSDLLTFGIYAETASNFLNMFWRRVQDPSGTTNMDFEFNQNTCATASDPGCTSNDVTPTRTPGDLLITYNLSNGGTNPTLFLHRWVTSPPCENSQEGGSGSNSLPQGEPGCWNVGVNLSGSGDADGSINQTAIPAAEADGLEAMSARTFGEAAVDLDAIFAGQCITIGSAYLKSRSSDTFGSTMKDFIAPLEIDPIVNCGSLKIVKQNDAGTNLAGAEFDVFKDDGDGDFQQPAGSDALIGSCTTTANGTGDCTFSDLLFGDYWVHETVVPDGHEEMDPNPLLVSVPSTDQVVVTLINKRDPASLKLKKVNDLGTGLPGATFTLFTDLGPAFGPPDGNGPNQDAYNPAQDSTISSGSCTTVADGTCTITNILTAGKFWIVETVVPANHSKAADKWIQIELGNDYDLTSTPFVNPRLHKVIVLVCHQGTNTLTSVTVSEEGTSRTGTSIGTNPAGISGNLCTIGGASFDGYTHANDPSFTADIGSATHP